MGSVEILSLFIPLKKGYEGDPLSPPEGEAAQGEHPLDPFLYISPVSKESFSSTSRGLSYFNDCFTGAEAKVAAAQKSVRTTFQ